MLTEIRNGVPGTLWDVSRTPLRGLPYGRALESVTIPVTLTDATREKCIRHAHDEWPRECLGAVHVDPNTGVQGYIRLRNAAESPTMFAEPDKGEWARVTDRYMVTGVHHSHTVCCPHKRTGLCPSGMDMQSQLTNRIPYFITCLSYKGQYMDFFGWGDQLPFPSLLERDFRSGVTDCYSLVRHAVFALSGVVLHDGPRVADWWSDPGSGNPITDNFADAGFRSVDPGDIQPGDALLFAIKPGLVSHCGLYLGHDLFLHHLHGRLSKVDPLPQWRRYLFGVARHGEGIDITTGKERRHADGDDANGILAGPSG